MQNATTAGYGSWRSQVTSDLVSSGAIRFDGHIEIDGDNLYWVEMRPAEAGRYVVVRHSRDSLTSDVTILNPYSEVREHITAGISIDCALLQARSRS